MTSPEVSTYWISATARTGVSACARLCVTALAQKAAAATKARPADPVYIDFCMRHGPHLAMRLGIPLQSIPQPRGWLLCSTLVLLFQEPALNQPARAAAPGRIGASAQVGLLDVDQRPGLGVANLVGHRVIRSADARDDPDHGLIRVEGGGDPGFAAIAIVQFAGLGRFVAYRADVDQLIASRLRDQPPRLFGRKPQLLTVDLVGGNIGRSGAEILQFKGKHRKFDWLRCGRFGRTGDREC